MAIANSVAAVERCRDLRWLCAGFVLGRNAQLEVLIAVLHRLNYQTGIDFTKF